MITIQIGSASKTIEEYDSAWAASQIGGRGRDKLPVCIRISIEEPGVMLSLVTKSCNASAATSGGGRSPNSLELEIFDLWQRHGLNEMVVKPGNLISFMNQLRRLFR